MSEDQWPLPGAMLVEPSGPADRDGRTPFEARWICRSTGRRRGQMFRTNLTEWADDRRKAGWSVVVLQQAG